LNKFNFSVLDRGVDLFVYGVEVEHQRGSTESADELLAAGRDDPLAGQVADASGRAVQVHR
jgi:hypothetical protein